MKGETKIINALSLFSNVGMAETYFSDLGVNVVVANELVNERAKFYSHLYPATNMICGDITNPEVFTEVYSEARKSNVDMIIAAPPCQGMSCAGRKDPMDPRNALITYAIEMIHLIKPLFVILENIPMQMHTKIKYKGEQVLIPQYVHEELSDEYNFNQNPIVNTNNYDVPQSRQRFIYLLARKDTNIIWNFPKPETRVITLKEAISDLPSLDPLVREESERWRFPDYETKRSTGLKISKWHYPPVHSWKQIEWMLHTPSGKSAFQNEIFFPCKDSRRIKGAPRTYMRMDWEKPATTVLQNNGVISTFSTVHPGRPLNLSDDERKRIYSDARVLSIYELLIVSSLPINWNIPDWANEVLIRKVIGEGIPPLLMKKVLQELFNRISGDIHD